MVKQIGVLIVACILVGGGVGCKTTSANQPAQTLAPGYLNQADEAMGETLAAAHAFYSKLDADAVAKTFTPSATEKTSLNNFAMALNVADATYLAYHSGKATAAQAQAAVATVSSQQAAIQQAVGSAVK